MKILHLIDSGGFYGAERMLLDLMEEQQRQGLSPTLCSIGDYSCDVKKIEKKARIKGLSLKVFRMRPGFNIYGMYQIIRYAKYNLFDILHSHGYKSTIIFGVLPWSIRNIPLICTFHGWTNTNALSKMTLYEWLERITLKYLDAVVLVNRLMVTEPRLVSAKVPERKLFVVENGIKIDESDNCKEDHEKNEIIHKYIRGNSFTICAIGRLSREKGYSYLLEAVYMLRDKGYDVKLVIFGEGSLLSELQNKVNELDLQNSVLFPGYLENANKFLRFFDVFVISSLTEGLPITLLEAMRENVLIVATKVGGIPDVIQNGESGYLIPPEDPKAIAYAIEYILKNPILTKSLTAQANKCVRQNYTSELMAKKYMDIYKKLVSGIK